MLTIKGLQRKVAVFDTDQAIDQAFTKTTGDLADENRKQLYAGFDKNGKKITPKYRRYKYAAAKYEMNPLPGLGTPDLKVTGAFYRGITVEYESGILHTESTDKKGPMLEQKYEDIFGLGGAFKKEFIDKSLRPALNKEITAGIGLKFQ